MRNSKVCGRSVLAHGEAVAAAEDASVVVPLPPSTAGEREEAQLVAEPFLRLEYAAWIDRGPLAHQLHGRLAVAHECRPGRRAVVLGAEEALLERLRGR